MLPSNPGNIIAYRLATYPSHYDNFTKIDNLPSVYNLTKTDNLTRIVTIVRMKGNFNINNRNKRFTVIFFCTSSTGMDKV